MRKTVYKKSKIRYDSLIMNILTPEQFAYQYCAESFADGWSLNNGSKLLYKGIMRMWLMGKCHVVLSYADERGQIWKKNRSYEDFYKRVDVNAEHDKYYAMFDTSKYTEEDIFKAMAKAVNQVLSMYLHGWKELQMMEGHDCI